MQWLTGAVTGKAIDHLEDDPKLNFKKPKKFSVQTGEVKTKENM
jgi:hypothetical protein